MSKPGLRLLRVRVTPRSLSTIHLLTYTYIICGNHCFFQHLITQWGLIRRGGADNVILEIYANRFFFFWWQRWGFGKPSSLRVDFFLPRYSRCSLSLRVSYRIWICKLPPSMQKRTHTNHRLQMCGFKKKYIYIFTYSSIEIKYVDYNIQTCTIYTQYNCQILYMYVFSVYEKDLSRRVVLFPYDWKGLISNCLWNCEIIIETDRVVKWFRCVEPLPLVSAVL